MSSPQLEELRWYGTMKLRNPGVDIGVRRLIRRLLLSNCSSSGTHWLPLLEHRNITPFGVNALNGESSIRFPFTRTTEWKKSKKACDGYWITSLSFLNNKAFDLCIRSPNLVQFHPSSVLSESSWKKKKRFTSHYICGSHQIIKPGGCSLFDQWFTGH